MVNVLSISVIKVTDVAKGTNKQRVNDLIKTNLTSPICESPIILLADRSMLARLNRMFGGVSLWHLTS